MYLHISEKSRTFAPRKIHYKPFKIISIMELYTTHISPKEEVLMITLLHKLLAVADKHSYDKDGDLRVEFKKFSFLFTSEELETLSILLSKYEILNDDLCDVIDWIMEG